MLPVDVVAIVAHPDDAELGCAGTLLKLKAAGYRTGIVDLTRGELGTRGTAQTRAAEAAEASRLLGLDVRLNLDLPDGFFHNSEAHQRAVIAVVRHLQPQLVIANALEDRHPDHGRGAQLVADACFLSGLRRIETNWEGKAQAAHRPRRVLHLIQDRYLDPTIVVDVTAFWPQKMQTVAAYATQFTPPDRAQSTDGEPQTHISTPDFWHFLEARGREMGHKVGATFGEGFVTQLPLAVDDLLRTL